MKFGKLGKYMLITLASFLLIISGFTVFLYGNNDSSISAMSKVNSASSATSSNENSSSDQNNNTTTNITITNNIVNNIHGGSGTTVETTVTNDINGDTDSEIKNQVDNNVSGNREAAVSNTIENLMNGHMTGSLDNLINNSINGTIQGLDNNILNDIKVNVDVNVSNDVNNAVNGDSEDNNKEDNNKDESKEEEGEENNENGTKPEDVEDIIWGIDSASETTEEFYACVRENFGDPVVVGRYLGERPGVSSGLTEEQVNLIHSEGAHILVIYNHFNDARGYDKGVAEAEKAINFAHELGVPEGVAIYANVEPEYPIDSEFIKGWYDTITASEYESGIYGIFDAERALTQAFVAAAEENGEILENTYLWTAAPNVGITTEANAPEFNPEAPENSLAWGWQYGIDAETCNIDTNLFISDLLDVLWSPES